MKASLKRGIRRDGDGTRGARGRERGVREERGRGQREIIK